MLVFTARLKAARGQGLQLFLADVEWCLDQGRHHMNILNEQINSVFSHIFSFEADDMSASIVNIM